MLHALDVLGALAALLLSADKPSMQAFDTKHSGPTAYIWPAAATGQGADPGAAAEHRLHAEQ